MSRRAKRLTRCAVSLLGFGIFALTVTVVSAQGNNPEITVTNPSQLERLSWGAILAGAILAIVIQLGLNLLGVGVGMTTINPAYDEDSATPKSLATGAAIWVGISTLLALFFGGWVAARFAGIPDNVDGMLHGLVTWALVMLISLFLLTTSIGRIISGVGSLISHGLHLATSTVGAVAQGAANVAAGAARGAASVAQSAASTASDAAQNAAQSAVDNTPEVNEAMQRFNMSRQDIEREATSLLQQAGIQPEQVRDTAQQAAQEAKQAVQQAAQDPAHADQIFSQALQRVFNQGQSVVEQADRDALLRVMRERTGMSEQQAQQLLDRWENSANTARQGVEDARRQASQRLQQAQRDLRAKTEEVREDAERTAREAAQATTDAISRIALVVFAALVVGAIAAGVGGLIGAPEVLPDVEIEVPNVATPHTITITPTPPPATPAGS